MEEAGDADVGGACVSIGDTAPVVSAPVGRMKARPSVRHALAFGGEAS